MEPREKGIISRQSLLDISVLTRAQRIALLKMVYKGAKEKIDIIKEAISDDYVFDQIHNKMKQPNQL